MAQGFDCFCGTSSCRGWISGAKDMKKEQLKGVYLNGHIRDLLEERDAAENGANGAVANGNKQSEEDNIAKVLRVSVEQVKKALGAAEKALETYETNRNATTSVLNSKAKARENGIGSRALSGEMGGDTTNYSGGETRRGITSREMSGEMGGDTVVIV
jgi:hypothetical protein